MSEQDEVKWLQGLRVGDDRAFKVLFEKYYASLCAFATNFVNDPDVAEDIVQEIFFKLYTDKPTFDVVVALLSEATQDLPEQTGQVFQLVMEVFDNAEIAEKLNLSIDSVKSHKKRGKQLLKSRLGDITVILLFLSNC